MNAARNSRAPARSGALADPRDVTPANQAASSVDAASPPSDHGLPIQIRADRNRSGGRRVFVRTLSTGKVDDQGMGRAASSLVFGTDA
jgi:hypothetical protein